MAKGSMLWGLFPEKRQGTGDLIFQRLHNNAHFFIFTDFYNYVISCCFSNKWPQPRGLKTTQLYSLTVLEVKSEVSFSELKARCQKGGLLLGPLSGQIGFLVFFSFSRPPVFLDMWPLPPYSKYSALISASITTFPSPLWF